MNWFNGSVEVAVKKALDEKKLFIVYIEGEDADSNKMEDTWNSEPVLDVCSENSCVAIKIKTGSLEAKQFSTFYPVLCIPSSYMINQSGVPIDIIPGYLDPESFTERVQKAIQATKETRLESEATDKERKPQEDQVVVPSEPSTSTTHAESSNGEVAGQSLDDKVERAKRLLEAKRREKEEADRQKEIENEKKRRQDGQSIATMKKMRMEKEARDLAKERALEKKEAKAEKERIKQKILQDKAEKAARFEASKVEENLQRERRKAEQVKAAEQARECPERLTSRIQFRMPDGSVLTQEYPSETTLRDMRRSFNEQTQGRFENARLATVYPRREFDTNDMDLSIKELNLVPNAAIIVLPQRQLRSTTSSGGIADFVKFILAPFIALLVYLKALLFGSSSANDGKSEPVATATSSVHSRNADRKPENDQSSYKRHGNVYKFSQDEDDDDDKDKKTWNGNSTQQL